MPQVTLSKQRKLENQLQENNIVKSELQQLKDKNQVKGKYSSFTGGVLLPVEYDEVMGNVDKRLGYINNEIKNCENL